MELVHFGEQIRKWTKLIIGRIDIFTDIFNHLVVAKPLSDRVTIDRNIIQLDVNIELIN